MYTNFSSLDQSELNTLLTPLQKINCQISPPHPLRRLRLLLPFYFVGYFLLLGQRQGYLSVCSVSLCSLVLPLLSNSRVQFSSVAQLYPTLWRHGLPHARLPCPSPTPRAYSNSCPSSQWCHPTIILCRPLLLLPSVFLRIWVFSNEWVLRVRWPKYWSISFSISPSNEYSGLISFRVDWLDLLAVQGTLKSLLQHHSSKASILWHSSL